MKKYLIILRNWRIAILAIMAMASFVLLVSDVQSVTLFFISKIAAFTLAIITYELAAHWRSEGKINEIIDLAKED